MLKRRDEKVPPSAVADDTGTIQIVDCGRGPQLSTSRITVQDLVPYVQQGCTDAEIMAIMPVLTSEDIQVIQQYVRDNYEAVMEQDRRIRERSAQRTNSPEIEEIRQRGHAKAVALMEQFARSKTREKNGDHSPR